MRLSLSFLVSVFVLLPPGYGKGVCVQQVYCGEVTAHGQKIFHLVVKQQLHAKKCSFHVAIKCPLSPLFTPYDKMFCGGSFRCKTIDKNDHYKLVKLKNSGGGGGLKISRTWSVGRADGYQASLQEEDQNATTTTGSTNRRIFLVPNKSVSGNASSFVEFQL